MSHGGCGNYLGASGLLTVEPCQHRRAVVLNEEDGMKSPGAVNLHNAVTVSQQRLGKRVAQLSSARMNEVCAAPALLFGLRFELVGWNVPAGPDFLRSRAQRNLQPPQVEASRRSHSDFLIRLPFTSINE